MSESHSKSPHVAKFVGRTTGSGPTPIQTLMRNAGGKRHFKTGGLVPVIGQAKATPAHPGKGYAEGGTMTPAARVPVNTEQQMLRKGGHRCRAAGGQMTREDDYLKAEGTRSGPSEMSKEDRPRRAMGGAAKTRKGFPNT